MPPHLVREERLRQKVGYGRTGISTLMETAVGQLMKELSQTGISISAGRLIACHTRDGQVLVIVENPDDEQELAVRITIDKRAGVTGDPKVDREIVLLEENRSEKIYRTLLPKGELLMMLFQPE